MRRRVEGRISYLILVMVAWLCKYTENHWIVHSTRVNFMVYELYFLKLKILEKKKELWFTYLLKWICFTLSRLKPKFCQNELCTCHLSRFKHVLMSLNVMALLFGSFPFPLIFLSGFLPVSYSKKPLKTINENIGQTVVCIKVFAIEIGWNPSIWANPSGWTARPLKWYIFDIRIITNFPFKTRSYCSQLLP